MTRRIYTYIAVCGAFLAGFMCVALLDPFVRLKLDPSLTLGNILQAVSTLVAGMVVALYLQPKTQADRKEKDIVLRHFDLLLEAVDELERLKDGGAVTEVAAALKRFSVGVKNINEMLKFIDCPSDAQKYVHLDKEIRLIRKLATETPISEIEAHAATSSSNAVKDGIIALALEKRVMLEAKLHDIKMRIFKAQITINSA
jgi:hypothetical protein